MSIHGERRRGRHRPPGTGLISERWPVCLHMDACGNELAGVSRLGGILVCLGDLDAVGGSKIVSDWLRLGFHVCVCLAVWLGMNFGDGAIRPWV